jgi:hypothetical protein
MHPALAEAFVRQHIEDLHKDAAKQRLARRNRNQQAHRRRVDARRLQRAPAQ